MGWLYNEVDNHVEATDDAALSMPDADWTLGGWLFLTDNAGTGFQYWYSHDDVLTAPSLTMWVREAGGVEPGRMFLGVNAVLIQTADNVIRVAEWQHLLAIRSGTTVTLYQNNSSVASGSLSAAINPTGNLFLGARNDLDAARFFGGRMAEWFKIDRAITGDERAALHLGVKPWRISGIHDPTSWYIPMLIGGVGGDYTEYIQQLTVTNNGSTNGDHAPVTLATPKWAATNPLAIPDIPAPVNGVALPPYGQVIFNSADEENRPRYGQRIARGTEE